MATGGKVCKEYEPGTLRGLLGSLKRYLSDRDYPVDIFQGKEFKLTRDTLRAKCVDLKEKGLGNRHNRAEPFTKSEIAQLYAKKLLGNDSPKSLTNSIWLNNTMHLGLRGRQEHLTMLWGDLETGATADGVEFLAFTERATKTRKGISSDHRSFSPKIFEQKGDPNCPVQLYKMYKEKRPAGMQKPESRFYVARNSRYGKSDKKMWFLNQPMGKNTLGCLAKKMSEEAGFQARHVNHSGRKTSISNLLDAGCHPTEVAQLSGHKNLMSLNHYHAVNIEKQRQMSNIIHSHTSTSNNSTALVHSDFNDPITDDQLVRASQEIENALSTIHNYEDVPLAQSAPVSSAVELPVRQSPGGSLHVSRLLNEMPQYLFNSCTFHNPVTIVLKQ